MLEFKQKLRNIKKKAVTSLGFLLVFLMIFLTSNVVASNEIYGLLDNHEITWTPDRDMNLMGANMGLTRYIRGIVDDSPYDASNMSITVLTSREAEPAFGGTARNPSGGEGLFFGVIRITNGDVYDIPFGPMVIPATTYAAASFFDFLDREIFEIILLTLRMTLTSTSISAVLGIMIGLWLARAKFRGKRLVVSINRTFMAAPPVVVGLVVFMLLRNDGVLGGLNWLFTLQAMVMAQVILITPIMAGMVHTSAERKIARIQAFAKTMGASKWQTEWLIIRELGNEIFFAIITGFGRAMSEVGAIMMVGGNIRGRTRTMTTTIALEHRRGELETAILLGVVLMLIAFVIQWIGNFLRKKERRLEEENF